MNLIMVGDLAYDGMFNKHHGLRFEVSVAKDGAGIKKVSVTPSLDANLEGLKILTIPQEIRPEISNFIREWLGYEKEPVYLSPRLN